MVNALPRLSDPIDEGTSKGARVPYPARFRARLPYWHSMTETVLARLFLGSIDGLRTVDDQINDKIFKDHVTRVIGPPQQLEV